MERKIRIGSVFVMFLLLMSGCGSKANTKANTYQIVRKTETATMAPTKIVLETTKPEKNQEQEDAQSVVTESPAVVQKENVRVDKNIKKMKPVFTSIALYMAEGRNYDQSDEECFYRIMAMLMNTRGDLLEDKQYQEKNEKVYVKEEAMREISMAAFSDHEFIGKIAKKSNEYIAYDKKTKTYFTNEVDPAEAEGRINRVAKNKNGNYIVSFDLLEGEGGDIITSLEFQLAKVSEKNETLAPEFSYRVISAKKLKE